MQRSGQGDHNRDGGKSDFGYFGEIELIRLPDGLDVGHKRKKRVNPNTKRFMACAVRRMKLP